MGCKQLWYQHAFHVKQRCGDTWCVFVHVFVCLCACVSVRVCVCTLFGTFSRRGVCYPCLLESDPRLCLIGVFTLSGLTHTDTLDLGSPPFAMKRENSDTETCLLLGCKEKTLLLLLSLCLFFPFSLVSFASESFITFSPRERDELFNHGSVILETCIKVIIVYLHCVWLELFFILPTHVHLHHFYAYI